MINKILERFGYVDETLLMESHKQYDAMYATLTQDKKSLIYQNAEIAASRDAYKLSSEKQRKKHEALKKHVKSKRK